MPVESKQLSPGITAVAISGRLVVGKETERLQNVVKDLLAAGEQSVFVFDLSALEYADSSGIGTLVGCLTSIKKAGSQMRVAGVNARMQRLFTLTGIDHLMTLFPTVEAAAAG